MSSYELTCRIRKLNLCRYEVLRARTLLNKGFTDWHSDNALISVSYILHSHFRIFNFGKCFTWDNSVPRTFYSSNELLSKSISTLFFRFFPFYCYELLIFNNLMSNFFHPETSWISFAIHIRVECIQWARNFTML